MSAPGSFVRRNFEPLVLSTQVLIDLVVILLACRAGYELREYFLWRRPTDYAVYREVFLLTSAVTLVCFHAFGMYSPLKSLRSRVGISTVATSTIASFLVVQLVLVLLRGRPGTLGWDHHSWLFSRATLLAAFFLIFLFTIVSRRLQVLIFHYLSGTTRRSAEDLA